MKSTKNTTLARKPANEMHKGVGETRPVNRADVKGNNRDMAFNGQMGTGVNKSHGREHMCANPYAHMVKNSDSINHGLIASNRKGNASDSTEDRMERVGPSATKDPNRHTIATARQGHPVESGYAKRVEFKNPDAIYMTKAER